MKNQGKEIALQVIEIKLLFQAVVGETTEQRGVSRQVRVRRGIAYFIIGSRKEGYLSRVRKLKPTLLTFPAISHPPSRPTGAIC